jgi:hypothetical protein
LLDEVRPAYREAVKVKKEARQAIGVEWALDQLLNSTPEDVTKLASHAATIRATLAKKQVDMPEFLEVVLKGMPGEAADANAHA